MNYFCYGTDVQVSVHQMSLLEEKLIVCSLKKVILVETINVLFFFYFIYVIQ